MTGSSQAGAPRLFRPVETTKLLAILSILGLIAVALAATAYKYPPPSIGLTMAGGLALMALLALAIARYETAVALGLLILGVQYLEPAPADAIFAVIIAVAAIAGRFDVSRIPLIVTGSIGALLLLGITSSIEASKPALAVYFHAITVYLAVFGLWLAYFVNSEARARLVFLAYLTGGLVCAGLGIAALITPIGALDQFAHFGLRAKGPFADQNVFGPFMIPLALILFEELLDPRMLRMRTPLKLAMLLVLSAAILLSFSRGAWMNAVIGLGVVLVVLALRRGGISRPGTLIVIVATTITAGLLAISLSGTGGYLSERGGAQKYDVNRFAAQEAGLEMAESHPLGIGPGQFEDTVGIGAHNTYIRVAAEQGPLGFIALLVLFGGTLALALGNTALGRHTYGIGSAALLGAWCGLLASSLFVDTLHWRHLWLVAALIWAGAMRGSVSRAPHGALAPRTRPRTTRDDR